MCIRDSSRTSEHRDWYIWRNGKGPRQPPNNWTSTFGGSAWKFDPTTNQYYYHYFYAQQPDLNWRNPAVQDAMFDVTRWWYKRGVSGLRLDAVDTLFEDPNLTNNPIKPGINALSLIHIWFVPSPRQSCTSAIPSACAKPCAFR